MTKTERGVLNELCEAIAAEVDMDAASTRLGRAVTAALSIADCASVADKYAPRMVAGLQHILEITDPEQSELERTIYGHVLGTLTGDDGQSIAPLFSDRVALTGEPADDPPDWKPTQSDVDDLLRRIDADGLGKGEWQINPAHNGGIEGWVAIHAERVPDCPFAYMHAEEAEWVVAMVNRLRKAKVPGSVPPSPPPADDAHVADGCRLFSDPTKVKEPQDDPRPPRAMPDTPRPYWLHRSIGRIHVMGPKGEEVQGFNDWEPGVEAEAKQLCDRLNDPRPPSIPGKRGDEWA